MNLRKKGHFHVVGAAGVGMSAVAQALVAHGHSVTGSDRSFDAGHPLGVVTRLTKAGIRFVPQDGQVLTPETRALVVSTAIEKDNPDIRSANRLNLPIIHRAAMLRSLVADHEVIAVAGTSGKTTVTGMLGWLFDQLGCDPFVVNGGAVLDWVAENRVGNVRTGQAAAWLIEADESDRSLLLFDPTWAIINTISKDHFELLEVKDLFGEFAAKVRRAIVCGPGVAKVLRDYPMTAEIIAVEDAGVAFKADGFRFRGVDFVVSQIGQHNIENALVAVVLGNRIGLDLKEMASALRSFKGIERRLEKVGVGRKGISIYDDYAHNPAKIQAAWRSLASHEDKIIGLWRPHGYGPLKAMKEELTTVMMQCMRPSDEFIVLPVYYAGGTARAELTAEAFVEHLLEVGVKARYMPSYDEALSHILDAAGEGDRVLCMGARDPELPKFSRRVLSAMNNPSVG